LGKILKGIENNIRVSFENPSGLCSILKNLEKL